MEYRQHTLSPLTWLRGVDEGGRAERVLGGEEDGRAGRCGCSRGVVQRCVPTNEEGSG